MKKEERPKASESSSTRRTHSASSPARPRRSPGAKAADILGHVPAGASPGGPSPTERVRAQWRWHHGVLLSLQRRLLRALGDLRHDVAAPLEPHSMDEADSATDEFDHDLALSQLSTEQDALVEVNEALRRIAAGTYGICEESGQTIPAARLRAVPWTRFTREVEERLEQKGLLRGARVTLARTVRKGDRVWLAPEEEAEEDEDRAPAQPNDEALPHVFSASSAPVVQQQASSPKRKARKRRKA